MIAGCASARGTARYRARHAAFPPEHWRAAGGLVMSSLGWGSYLGSTGAAAEARCQEAALRAMQSGINVLDTASNYRQQASERDLGRALARFVAAGGSRDEVVVATKAGFLHGDAHSPLGADWFAAQYVESGVVVPQDVVAKAHCMTPRYVRHEIGRSLGNLGVETIDIQFVHNPETQLAAGVPEAEFYARLEDLFAMLEEEVDAGRIQVYGIATWDGLRVPPGAPGHIDLVKVVHAAGQARIRAGGPARDHHMRAIELPFNLAMPEAATVATQPWRYSHSTPLDVAREQGWVALVSASLMQGRLAGRVPASWKQASGIQDDLHGAFQFARSAPGVTCALVGTMQPAHVAEGVGWAMASAPDPDAVDAWLSAGHSLA